MDILFLAWVMQGIDCLERNKEGWIVDSWKVEKTLFEMLHEYATVH